MTKPSEIEYVIGQRVTLRRGRAKPRAIFVVTDIKSYRTSHGTPIYGLVKESNGFPTSASAADIVAYTVKKPGNNFVTRQWRSEDE